MAVLTKEQFMENFKKIIGDSTSDDVVQMLEDVTDTYKDFESRSNNQSGEDWKAKFEENDKMWREKYTKAFFSGEPTPEPPASMNPPAPEVDPEEEKADSITIDDLFTESEG